MRPARVFLSRLKRASILCFLADALALHSLAELLQVNTAMEPLLQAQPVRWTAQRAARLRNFIVSLVAEHRLASAPECRSFVRAGHTSGQAPERGPPERRGLSPSERHASPLTFSSAGVQFARPRRSLAANTEREPVPDQVEHAFSVAATCALKRIAQVPFDPRARLSWRNSVGRTLACLAAVGMAKDARRLLDVCVGRTRTPHVELKRTNEGESLHVAGGYRGGEVEAQRWRRACDAEIVETLIEKCPLYAFADMVGAFASLRLIDPKSLQVLQRRTKLEERRFTARTLTYLALSAKELPSPLDAEYLESLCPAIASCLSRHPEAFKPRFIARIANACARHASRAQIHHTFDLLQDRMLDTLDEFDGPSLVLALCEFSKVSARHHSLFSACVPRLRAMIPFLTPVDTVMLLATLETVCWKTSGAFPAWPSSGPVRELAHAVLCRLHEEGPASLQSDGRSICRLLDILSRMPQEPLASAVFDAVCGAVGAVEKSLAERQIIDLMNACSRLQRLPPLCLISAVFAAGERLLFTCDPKYVALFWHALPAFLDASSLEFKAPGADESCLSSTRDEERLGGLRWKEGARQTSSASGRLEYASSTEARSVAGSHGQVPSARSVRQLEQAEHETGSHVPGNPEDRLRSSAGGFSYRGGRRGSSCSQSSWISADVSAMATRLLSELCDHLAGRETPHRPAGSATTDAESSGGSWSVMQPRDMAMILNAMSRMELIHLGTLRAADADLGQPGRLSRFTIHELTLTLNAFSRLRFQLSPRSSDAISERLQHFVRCQKARHSSSWRASVREENDVRLTDEEPAPVGLLCCLAHSLVKLESPVCQTSGFLGLLELIAGMCSESGTDPSSMDTGRHSEGVSNSVGAALNRRELQSDPAAQPMSKSRQGPSDDAAGRSLGFRQSIEKRHDSEHVGDEPNCQSPPSTQEFMHRTPAEGDDRVQWNGTARNLSLALFATTFWSYASRTSLAISRREREISELDAPLLFQIADGVASAARQEGWRLDRPARRQCLMSALVLWTMWMDKRARSLRLQSQAVDPFLRCAQIIVGLLDMNHEKTDVSDCRSSTVQEEVYRATQSLITQRIVLPGSLLKPEERVLLYTIDLLLIRDMEGPSGEVPTRDEPSAERSSTLVSSSEKRLWRANESDTRR